MRHPRWAWALSLCALLTAGAHARDAETDAPPNPTLGQVFDLTDLNFDRVVNGTGPWMVDVFAPW